MFCTVYTAIVLQRKKATPEYHFRTSQREFLFNPQTIRGYLFAVHVSLRI